MNLDVHHYLVLIALSSLCVAVAVTDPRQRHARLFSLFNVVKFKNDQCISTEDDRRGICMTTSECSTEGGDASGSCASGFGVCCLFTIAARTGQVSHNCTHVRNEDFPNSIENDNADAGPNSEYTLNRIDTGIGGICQIRLDFVSQTSLAVDAMGGCIDMLTVESPFSGSAAAFPPTLCGVLTGQHMYFEAGDTGDAGTISITTGALQFPRRWDIKVQYIECSNDLRAPSGCHQYFFENSGQIQSFNYAGGIQLENMRTVYCIRQEEGMCNIQWSVAGDAPPDPFRLSDPALEAETRATKCSLDNRGSVHIPDHSTPFCGGIFSAVKGDTLDTVVGSSAPFQVRHLSRQDIAAGLIGFRLCYTQTTC